MQLRVTLLSNRMERGVILTQQYQMRGQPSRSFGRRHAGKLSPLP